MNLTWHIVKKDLRALRWPLLGWIALIVAKLVTGILLLTMDGSGDAALFSRLTGLGMFLSGLECLGVVLVAVLIHEDRLVGTAAFWVTRPISGSRLLAAKGLGLLVIFVAVPVGVTLPWWLGCGLGWQEIVWAAAETTAVHLLVVLLGLLVAVVTDGLGRFFMWTLALVAAMPLGAALVFSHYARKDAVIPPDLASTRFVVVVAVAIIGVAVAVLHQFLTRRTERTLGVIAAMIALLPAVALWWPWSWALDSSWQSWLARREEAIWPDGAEPPGLTFTLAKAEQRKYPGKRKDRDSELLVSYRVEGLPENQTLMPAVASFSLRWADGTTDGGWSWSRSNWPERILLRALQLPAGKSGDSDLAEFRHILGEKVARRLEAESAAYILKARLSLVEAGGATIVPLAKGDAITVGSRSEHLGWVEKEDEQLLVTYVSHRSLGVRDLAISTGSYILGTATTAWPHVYALVNPANGHVDWGVSTATRSTRVAGVEILWNTKAYRAMPGQPAEKPRWEAIRALEDAKLMRIAIHARGSFSREFTIEPLSLSRVGK